MKIDRKTIKFKDSFSLCRKLIREGYDPKERLEIWGNYNGPDIVITSLEEGAKWSLDEDNLRIVKYRPPARLRKGA